MTLYDIGYLICIFLLCSVLRDTLLNIIENIIFNVILFSNICFIIFLWIMYFGTRSYYVKWRQDEDDDFKYLFLPTITDMFN